MTEANEKLIAEARKPIPYRWSHVWNTMLVHEDDYCRARDQLAALCDALEAETEARKEAEARQELEKHGDPRSEWNRRSGYEEMCAKFAESLNKSASRISELEEENRRMRKALDHYESAYGAFDRDGTPVDEITTIGREATTGGRDGDRSSAGE